MSFYITKEQRSEDIRIPVSHLEPACVYLCKEGHGGKCDKKLTTDLTYNLGCICSCHEHEFSVLGSEANVTEIEVLN